MLVKVKDHPGLIKDTVTGAVLSVDKTAADEYLRQKNLLNSNRKMQEEVLYLKDKIGEIDSLKEDMTEIKSLLKELINKGQ
jgi:hypothetical protein